MCAVVLRTRNTKSIPVKTGPGRVTAFLNFFAADIQISCESSIEKQGNQNKQASTFLHENHGATSAEKDEFSIRNIENLQFSDDFQSVSNRTHSGVRISSLESKSGSSGNGVKCEARGIHFLYRFFFNSHRLREGSGAFQ
jgi:hypothetical protein